MSGQHRVRRNDWGTLPVPALGAWEPTLSVSVVVPAWDAGALLPFVLAGLAAQSYPDHLLEVVVVDDGPTPLTLPEVSPERTRIVPAGAGGAGWGRANACHVGALAAEGDVLHWYDADMLAERCEVEAQARWHHLIDHAVPLGNRLFVDPAPLLGVDPAEVRTAVQQDRVSAYFPVDGRQPHTWTEELYARTDDLRALGWFAVRAHVGMTGSVRRDLYLESGGMDRRLRLGEDTALGVRLGEVGAVFVPDRESMSWHLGLSNVMRRAELVNAYNSPFLAERSPVLRAQRRPGHTYAVPYLEVVLDSRGHEAADVVAVVDSVLAGTLHDVSVTLLGDWSTLTDDRVAVLDDPTLPTRVVHTTYAGEPRVRLLEQLPPGLSGSPFRLTLPGPAFAPRRTTLERLLLHLEHTHDGLRLLHLKDGTTARLERTAAYARATRVAAPGDDLDAVVDAVAGVEELSGPQVGFGPSAKVRPPIYPRTGGPAVSSAEAWERVDQALASRGNGGGGGHTTDRLDR